VATVSLHVAAIDGLHHARRPLPVTEAHYAEVLVDARFYLVSCLTPKQVGLPNISNSVGRVKLFLTTLLRALLRVVLFASLALH
jgi:hypothetical protein